MDRNFRPRLLTSLPFIAPLFLLGMTACSQKQSIQGTWVRVYNENLTGYDKIEELWIFNQDTVYSKLIIDNDSVAYESASKYSIDSKNELLKIHIIDKERRVDTITKVTIKALTDKELELISERNEFLKFEKRK